MPDIESVGIEALAFEVERVELDDQDRQRLAEDPRAALVEVLEIEGQETNGLYVEFSEKDIAGAQSLMALHCINPPERKSTRMVISEPTV